MEKNSLRALESASIGSILTAEQMGFVKGGGGKRYGKGSGSGSGGGRGSGSGSGSGGGGHKHNRGCGHRYGKKGY